MRYLNDPLDETYITQPGAVIQDGELPIEDMEIRGGLVEMKLLTEQAMSFGILRRLFSWNEYHNACLAAARKQLELKSLVNSTPAHKAAIRRIVNAMPKDNGGREALAAYTL